MPDGYFRYPALHGDRLAYTCEDDLWLVPAEGGTPERLNAGVAEATHAAISPDGRWLAFTGREEGRAEVYVMPLAGGRARRLTHEGALSLVVGFSPDSREVLFASTARQAFDREFRLFAVSVSGGEPAPRPEGPGRFLSTFADGRHVLGRSMGDPARWKRYKGGTAGEIWCESETPGDYRLIVDRVGNPSAPMAVGDRVYFLADHEGVGNLYSCDRTGAGLARHTDHEVFYARHATTDGRRIAYQSGGDLYVFDPASGEARRVSVSHRASGSRTARKFIAPAHLDGVALAPDAKRLALAARGQWVTLAPFEGPVVNRAQTREPEAGNRLPERYRLPFVWGAEGWGAVRHDASGDRPVTLAPGGEALPLGPEPEAGWGRAVEVAGAPGAAPSLAYANHRHELWMLAEGRSPERIDHSPYGAIRGLAFSPDGRFLAYARPVGPKTTEIRLWEAATGAVRPLAAPLLVDAAPAWDPAGRYVAFLSARVFRPVYDQLHFDLGFPKGVVPVVAMLQAGVRAPFDPVAPYEPPMAPEGEAAPPLEVRVDWEGLDRRALPLPVPEARYAQVVPLKDKLALLSAPVVSGLDDEADQAEGGELAVYDFKTRKLEPWMSGVSAIQATPDGEHLLVELGDRLRLVPSGEKPKDDDEAPGRESGYLDLAGRVRLEIDPLAEWAQMFEEAWQLQRDQFWTADMSGVDWEAMRARYLPLLPRLASRGDLSDLLWELQGELGTSHAYEYGGDYRTPPHYPQGFLGCGFAWEEAQSAWRLTAPVPGEPGDADARSPFETPGAGLAAGQLLVAVDGVRLGPALDPRRALVHKAEAAVSLTVRDADGGPEREVVVQALKDETSLRYRDWVRRNRQAVHEATGGRVGYVHVPDMGPAGYAEFHRGYLAEFSREGLVIDVRHNGGGHVSQLLLEKLARRRLGYDVERWGAVKPYPDESPLGPMVCLTDEQAGSDGDMFSHAFKALGLGPLLGKRTWGGVIGIWPRHPLADGTVTTQPEYSFWFKDAGWAIENHGATPDREIDFRPQDHASGRDPQLEAAIAEALARVESREPEAYPPGAGRPVLAPPKLPPRG